MKSVTRTSSVRATGSRSRTRSTWIEKGVRAGMRTATSLSPGIESGPARSTAGSVHTARRDRPSAVMVLAMMEIVSGAVFLLGGGALLTIAGAGSTSLRTFGMIHIPIAVSFLILGALTATVRRRWIWTLGLGLAIISIVDDIAAFALVTLPLDGIIGTAVVLFTALAAIFLLVRADVREFFSPRAQV